MNKKVKTKLKYLGIEIEKLRCEIARLDEKTQISVPYGYTESHRYSVREIMFSLLNHLKIELIHKPEEMTPASLSLVKTGKKLK